VEFHCRIAHTQIKMARRHDGFAEYSLFVYLGNIQQRPVLHLFHPLSMTPIQQDTLPPIPLHAQGTREKHQTIEKTSGAVVLASVLSN